MKPTDGAFPPFMQVDASLKRSIQFDDMSSIHQSIVDVDEATAQHLASLEAEKNAAKQRNEPQRHDSNKDHSDDPRLVAHQRAMRRRNRMIIITLLFFIGIVAAIGAAVVVAMKNVSEGDESREANQAVAGENVSADEIESEAGSDDAESDNATAEVYNGSEQESGVSQEIISSNTTSVPTLAPSSASPTICIPIELGIIFNKNANLTEWKVVKESPDTTTNEIVWQSTFYDSTYNSQAVTFQNCLPPTIYSFSFINENGTRSYVLSSEGTVISTGDRNASKEDKVVFELPYVIPDPIDANGDGFDDRLGTLMPYNSTGLTEGVDCEMLRVELKTDNLGVETLWALYEGVNFEKLVANGGPYGSNSLYVYEFCLESPKPYTFYIYDWASNGLCCESGEGYYMLSSGEEIIVNATRKFGGTDVTAFTLPTYLVPSKSPTYVPTISNEPSSSPIILTLSPAPSQEPSDKPTLEPTKPPKNNGKPGKDEPAKNQAENNNNGDENTDDAPPTMMPADDEK